MMSWTSDFEIIAKDGAELCYIIRAELAPDATAFVILPRSGVVQWPPRRSDHCTRGVHNVSGGQGT